MEKAKEAFVFLVVAINESWKIPVGYFLINHVNSSQKAKLVQCCIHLLSETGVTVVSLTFDGCTTNIGMGKALGCVLDSIYNHNSDNGSFSNHIIFLIKSIINLYFDIKTHYSCRKQNETESLRTWYNKMTIFRGQ